MKNFFTSIDRSFNGFIANLLFIGLVLLFFAILIAFVDFVLRLLIAISFLAVACIFFYTAYKLYMFKKHIKDLLPRIK